MGAEEKIGVVTDYYARIGVAAISLTDGDIRAGDRIRVRGQTTDFTQSVESLEVEHRAVERAQRGSEVALKTRERVRRHDQVFRLGDG
ncbi:MAG: translation elongation factor-like protein [Candidatus Rokubacteria bacterium]|nr:translation elongation factor-like protein [Candidatus Rokubacteria bacterium]